jgi:hypothetical protein
MGASHWGEMGLWEREGEGQEDQASFEIGSASVAGTSNGYFGNRASPAWFDPLRESEVYLRPIYALDDIPLGPVFYPQLQVYGVCCWIGQEK